MSPEQKPGDDEVAGEFYREFDRKVGTAVGQHMNGGDFILLYAQEDGRVRTVATTTPSVTYKRLKDLVDNWKPTEVDNFGG